MTHPESSDPDSGPTAERLRALVEASVPRLRAMSDADARARPAPGKWCAKEVVGHMIDSAVNNHVRFVNGQQTDRLVFGGYDQEHWVQAQDYRNADWQTLIGLWELCNLNLARVIALVPDQVAIREAADHNMDRIAWKTVPGDQPASLGYLMDDYVAHLSHHLEQINP